MVARAPGHARLRRGARRRAADKLLLEPARVVDVERRGRARGDVGKPVVTGAADRERHRLYEVGPRCIRDGHALVGPGTCGPAGERAEPVAAVDVEVDVRGPGRSAQLERE